MSIGRYVTGFVIILAVTGAAALMGYAVRRRYVPEWRGAQARLAESVVAIAIVVLESLALGLLHVFNRGGLLVASAVLLAAGCTWLRRTPGYDGEAAPAAAKARTLGRPRRRRQRHRGDRSVGRADDSRCPAWLFRLRHAGLPPADGPALGAERGHRTGTPDRPGTARRLLPRECGDLPRRGHGGVAERRPQPRAEPGLAAAGSACRLGDRPALGRGSDRDGRHRARARRPDDGAEPAGQRHDRRPLDGTAARRRGAAGSAAGIHRYARVRVRRPGRGTGRRHQAHRAADAGTFCPRHSVARPS